MIIAIKLILIQLFLKCLIELIYIGSQNDKNVYSLIFSSIVSILILIVMFLHYQQVSDNTLNILILLTIIISLELLFNDIQNVTNYPLIVYIISLQNHLKNNNQYFTIVSHFIVLYIIVRLLITQYDQLEIHQFVLLIIWQPLNHLLIKTPKKQPTIQLSPTHQHQQSQQHSQQHSQHIQMMSPNITTVKQNTNPIAFENDNIPIINKQLSITEEILSCLPYGVILIDSECNLIKYNNKCLNYLAVTEYSEILSSLDQLLQNAELNQLRSPKGRKQQVNQTIVHLKHLKQSASATRSHYDQGSKCKKAWISDRISLKESMKANCRLHTEHQAQYFYINCVMADFAIKAIPSQGLGQSVNSELTNHFKFQVKSYSIKQRHFQIKAYQVDSFTVDGSYYYLFIIENITNKEELKELSVRFKFQQSLLNSFSHELRTPLNCTLSLLQILANKVEHNINQQYLQPAIISSKRLLYQLNDILDLAQIECNDFKLNFGPINPKDIINSIVSLFQMECEQKQIQLIMDCNINTILHSDNDRITQVLVNLLSNSIKFTRQGGRIVISVRRKDKLITFSVWDNGKGISIDQISQLFQTKKIFQYESQSHDSSKFGIGIKVCQGIIKHLSENGEMHVKSQEGFYTLISFDVQAELHDIVNLEINSEQIINIQQVYESPIHSVTQCQCNKILIVDDVPFNHIALSTMLQHYNLSVDNAYDGDQAILKVLSRSVQKCCKVYKVVFMDIEMPGKNGFTTSKEISSILRSKQLDDKTNMIMCSAYTGEDDINQAKQCGMKGTLPKPISLKSLQNIIDKYLQ